MGVAVSIVLTVILVALIFMPRRNKASTDKRSPRPGHQDLAMTASQYHAVSIQFADGACEAARAMEGKRILSGAAPRIPLPECDVAECKCRFIHHKDRRRREDRRDSHTQDMLGTTGGYSGKERRYRGDRRNNDPEDFFS